MRNRLERRYGQGHLHFITFSCAGRRPLLGTIESRDCFVRILGEVRGKYLFRLIGYVVMPEHVHLLIGEPIEADPSRAVQALKQRVAIKLLAKRRAGVGSTSDHFWQRRFYDFNVFTGKKITEKLTYMHLNPVKRDLVAHLRDWPWSSWSQYACVDQGLIPIDRWNVPIVASLN